MAAPVLAYGPGYPGPGFGVGSAVSHGESLAVRAMSRWVVAACMLPVTAPVRAAMFSGGLGTLVLCFFALRLLALGPLAVAPVVVVRLVIVIVGLEAGQPEESP